ncbi:centriole and centriolar satellite protein ofd1 isoform X1 [Phycodurus eques]|uniref:centriole and centriolar satellite protein ofd1 isoform X1 n=1 Tax=Phycodurus eques TaxID=693459 RepID=UPI002ACD9BD1|nr:centriole and centriolar satellite protein ofd1 isoform X1 [Phycodurus eques]XP_061547234.1 centriole and centriolar satellite protein ofd1 isoform X1 [Phycodurus eques]
MSTKEDALSPDELRKRLYKTLRDRGVLDTLKTQLRNQLIHELKPGRLSAAEPSLRSDSLLVSVCNNIVADYLHCSGYEYSLSVFCPESGLCKEKVFKKGDLLQLLKISPQSPFYKSLYLSINDTGFLINLVSHVTDHQTACRHRDADTQTTSSASYEESLVEKMKMIDKEYENVNYSGGKWFSFQSKLASYKRELESQMQIEMNTKMQHFKEVELAKVKMEEKVQFQKEFDKLKQELERTYEMKTTALNTREKHAIERLQKQQEIEERNVYMQRQMVLKEIDTLRNRENELRLRMESFEETCQIHEEKVKTGEELLRRRELAVKTMEEMHDQRLKNELSSYQLELKEDYNKRAEQLTASEKQNKEESIRIQKDSAAAKAKLEKYNKACSEMKRLQVELDAAQQQTSLLRQQNELLRERLENMSDFPNLKEDNARLQGQVKLLKKQLEEAQEENRHLSADLGKPSDEQLALQVELRKLQSACKIDKEEFANQKHMLQKQLQLEVERCGQLNVQLMEVEEKLQWTTTHVEDLKMQLHQTQQALENEVLFNPKPSLVDRSVLDFTGDKLVPPDIYVDREALMPLAAYEHVADVGRLVRGDSNSDLEMLAECNARMRQLEREAESLEEKCLTYQQRAARSSISRRRPATPSSRADSPLLTLTSDLSHPYTAHLSNTFIRPVSPEKAGTPSPAAYDAGNAFPAGRHRVTFYQEQLQKSYGTSSLSSAERQSARNDDLSQGQHSFTHRSFPTRRTLRRDAAEEVTSSPLFRDMSHDSHLPSAHRSEASSSGEFSPELSPPRSPRLQSTVRDQRSSPSQQRVSSSSHSSPQPERINVEDLTGISPEPGHIPELVLDTAVPLSSSEAPGGPSVPRPQAPRDLPETATDPRGRAEPSRISSASEDEDKLDEEQRWERERKERQEVRRREQEEAREREQQKAERLEKETLLQQQQRKEEKEEDEEEEKKEGRDEFERQEAEVPSENPLEKYMKMVLEAREKKQDKSSGGEEEHVSPEVKSLSEEKDNSIAAYSHKDEDADDDFW